jgi:hypothetical protein
MIGRFEQRQEAILERQAAIPSFQGYRNANPLGLHGNHAEQIRANNRSNSVIHTVISSPDPIRTRFRANPLCRTPALFIKR